MIYSNKPFLNFNLYISYGLLLFFGLLRHSGYFHSLPFAQIAALLNEMSLFLLQVVTLSLYISTRHMAIYVSIKMCSTLSFFGVPLLYCFLLESKLTVNNTLYSSNTTYSPLPAGLKPKYNISGLVVWYWSHQ